MTILQKIREAREIYWIYRQHHSILYALRVAYEIAWKRSSF